MRKRVIHRFGGIVLCAFAGNGVAPAEAEDVAPNAVAPYTADTHPRLALKWGMDALPHINRLRVSAAEKAARSRECDSVTAAELFDLRSESPAHWTIRVECGNGRTFFLRQADLKRRL